MQLTDGTPIPDDATPEWWKAIALRNTAAFELLHLTPFRAFLARTKTPGRPQ